MYTQKMKFNFKFISFKNNMIVTGCTRKCPIASTLENESFENVQELLAQVLNLCLHNQLLLLSNSNVSPSQSLLQKEHTILQYLCFLILQSVKVVLLSTF